MGKLVTLINKYLALPCPGFISSLIYFTCFHATVFAILYLLVWAGWTLVGERNGHGMDGWRPDQTSMKDRTAPTGTSCTEARKKNGPGPAGGRAYNKRSQAANKFPSQFKFNKDPQAEASGEAFFPLPSLRLHSIQSTHQSSFLPKRCQGRFCGFCQLLVDYPSWTSQHCGSGWFIEEENVIKVKNPEAKKKG